MILTQNTNKLIRILEKEKIDFRYDKKIVILNSFTADYILDDKLSKNTYDMTKLPFQIPEEIHEFTAFVKIYNDQIKIASYLPFQIITMNYNIISAELLKNLRSNQAEMSYVSNWLIFAFFAEDEAINELNIENNYLLDKKVDEIVSMLDYPFIKKYEFPIRYNITADYFTNFLNNN